MDSGSLELMTVRGRSSTARIATSDPQPFFDALDACEARLRTFPADEPVREMRPTIAVLAARAKRNGVPAERLLKQLKELLFRLPHFGSRQPAERGAMMHQLVSVAIDAYYPVPLTED
jgi:hypothetical protein